MTPQELAVAMAVSDPLMRVDERGEIVPHLAESMTPNADSTIWTLVVRDEVTLDGGAEVAAGHVAAQLEAALSSPVTAGLLRGVESVRAVDVRTVEITLTHGWPSFPAHLTGQLGLIAGTGPFTVRGRTLVARDDYWRPGLPRLDSIVMTGEALPEHVEREGGADVLVLNAATPPFDDVACRQAVSAAVEVDDRADGPFGESREWFDGDVDASCDRFTVRVDDEERGDELAEELRAAGLDVTVEVSDPSRLRADAHLGAFQALVWHEPAVAHPDLELPRWDVRATGDVGTVSLNLSRYRNQELLDLLLDARASGDPDRYESAAAIITREVPIVVLEPATWAYSTDTVVGNLHDVLPGVLDLAQLQRT